jgi:hypothetical protein
MTRRSFNEHTGGWRLLRDSLEKTVASDELVRHGIRPGAGPG